MEEQQQQLTNSQKVLFVILCNLILLMVLFSLLAVGNLGQEGYQHCVEQKCQERGDQFCSKARELVNCCEGAGGTFSASQFSADLKHTACRFD